MPPTVRRWRSYRRDAVRRPRPDMRTSGAQPQQNALVDRPRLTLERILQGPTMHHYVRRKHGMQNAGAWLAQRKRCKHWSCKRMSFDRASLMTRPARKKSLVKSKRTKRVVWNAGFRTRLFIERYQGEVEYEELRRELDEARKKVAMRARKLMTWRSSEHACALIRQGEIRCLLVKPMGAAAERADPSLDPAAFKHEGHGSDKVTRHLIIIQHKNTNHGAACTAIPRE